MSVSFVIPCYNSEATIASVIHDIVSIANNLEYEIICVNDGSADGTWSKLLELSNTYNSVQIINLSKNFGQHNALMAGFKYVNYDVIVCLDDDGQTPASDALKLIDALSPTVDVVYARYPEKKHSFIRNLGSKFTAFTGKLILGYSGEIVGSSFFATKRFVIDALIKYENPYTFIQGIILQITNKLANVEIEHHERVTGSSGYSMRKLISLWLNSFTTYSVKPLRIASFCGIAFAFLGFLFTLIIIVRKLLNPSIAAGYSSVMAAILFVGGLLMIMLGMLGEYIGRAYISINNAPQYVVRDAILKK